MSSRIVTAVTLRVHLRLRRRGIFIHKGLIRFIVILVMDAFVRRLPHERARLTDTYRSERSTTRYTDGLFSVLSTTYPRDAHKRRVARRRNEKKKLAAASTTDRASSE